MKVLILGGGPSVADNEIDFKSFDHIFCINHHCYPDLQRDSDEEFDDELAAKDIQQFIDQGKLPDPTAQNVTHIVNYEFQFKDISRFNNVCMIPHNLQQNPQTLIGGALTEQMNRRFLGHVTLAAISIKSTSFGCLLNIDMTEVEEVDYIGFTSPQIDSPIYFHRTSDPQILENENYSIIDKYKRFTQQDVNTQEPSETLEAIKSAGLRTVIVSDI